MYDLLPGIASSTKFSAVGMSKNQGGGHFCVCGSFSPQFSFLPLVLYSLAAAVAAWRRRSIPPTK